jgi:cytochrome b involved in lipid metabolism
MQGKAYDVTEFLPGMPTHHHAFFHDFNELTRRLEHPGGPKIILKYAVSLN